MEKKIVSVGEATVDRYPDHQLSLPGGISLNFAVHARQCGAAHVSLVSAVGDDDNGRLIMQALAHSGIDASHVMVTPDATAWCDILIRPSGERYFPPNSYHQNCMADFALSADDLAFVRTHDLIVSRYDQAYSSRYFDQVMLQLDFAGRRVADFGSWFDYEGDHAQIFPYFPAVDVAFISGDETTVNALAPTARAAGTLLIVTRGAAGSSAILKRGRVDQPAVPVENVVDTTGAGDGCQAAFVVTYLRSGDVQQALAAGAQRASKTIQHLGAS